MSRHDFEMTEIPHVQLDAERRGAVASALEPHMRDPAELDEAIREVERILTSTRGAQKHGLGEKPKRVDASVRVELEEIEAIGNRLLEIGRRPSDDARWFLTMTDRDLRYGETSKQDGFGFILQSGARLKRWGRSALKELEAEGQPAISRGPAYRGDMLLGGEKLADLWTKYTGKGLSRHNRDLEGTKRDDGPFPTFLRAALKAVDPYFEATLLARHIHESRREGKRVE
jgi:hypothetical protein